MEKVHQWNCVLVALITAVGVTLGVGLGTQPANAAGVDSAVVPPRTQITVVNLDGQQSSTPGGSKQVSGLSLSKLYLAHWVLYHGAPEDKLLVHEMIRVSHDGIATELDRKYPQAIPKVVSQFGLSGTTYSGHWGGTRTTTNDVARFVSAIRFDPISQPIMEGMRQAAPTGADGYPQNFGTARLAGIEGTKFGWADAHDQHATVSIGAGFVVAAHTYGSAEQHTEDVLKSVQTIPFVGPAAKSDSAQLREKLSCVQPQELVNAIPDGITVPEEIMNAMAVC